MNKIPKVSIFFDHSLASRTRGSWFQIAFDIPRLIIKHFSDLNGPPYNGDNKAIRRMFSDNTYWELINEALKKTRRIEVVVEDNGGFVCIQATLYGRGKGNNLYDTEHFLVDLSTGELMV